MESLKIFLVFIFATSTALISAQSIPLTTSASVSILTCDKGTEIYSLFGHTAIRIKDPSQNLDIVYNYGAFDFATPNFVLKFTKGDLQYFVTAESYTDFLLQYYMEKRSVYEQVLNLSPQQKQKLFDELNRVMSTDERYYTYKFIDRNCTNMAVDDVNDILGTNAIVKRGNTSQDYRQVLYPYFDGHFFEQLGTSIIFGSKVDERATKLFLPIEFLESLDVTMHNGKRIAGEPKTLLRFPEQKPSFSWWNNIYLYLLILAAVVALRKKYLTLAYLTIIGLIGVFFVSAGFYSLHEEVKSNYNILLFNPILLIILIFSVIQKRKIVFWTSIIYLLCIAVYLIIVIGKVYFLIVLPIILVNIFLIAQFMHAAKKRISYGNPAVDN